jgi:hypothetical protein
MRDRPQVIVKLGSLREFADLTYLAAPIELLVGTPIPPHDDWSLT